MNFLKYFVIFLSVSISWAIYWAYYLSNIANTKTDVEIWSWKILNEQQLFAKYKINKQIQTWTWENILNEEIEIFEEIEKPGLEIIRTTFSGKKDVKPEEKITINFEKEIDIYSLLWFKKIENWEYECDWKILKSEKKAERCESENKIFITKKWNEDEIFKWVVKKSEIDKKTIIITTNLEKLQDYELKISKWLKSFNSEDWAFSELKEDFIVNFATTDSEWNTKEKTEEEVIEEISNETWSVLENWTWEILENTEEITSWTWETIKEKTEEEKQKELEEWLKQKESEVWTQNTEDLKKASEEWLLEKETWTWETN